MPLPNRVPVNSETGLRPKQQRHEEAQPDSSQEMPVQGRYSRSAALTPEIEEHHFGAAGGGGQQPDQRDHSSQQVQPMRSGEQIKQGAVRIVAQIDSLPRQ